MSDLLFSNFTWYELFGPVYLALMILFSYLYTRHIIHSKYYYVSRTQIFYFFCSASLFYLVKGSPFSVIASNYLFSAHVFQLSIILFVATPLFILSLPTKLLRKYLWHHTMRFALNILAHPWLTAFTFNGLITLYFIPSIFNSIQGNTFLLTIAQTILIFNAFLLWWVIINPVPEMKSISNLTKVAFIFFASVLLMPISFFLLVILKEHYPFYVAVSGDFAPVLTAIYDQQLGGGVLKIIQIVSYAYALLHIVMSWGRSEEEKEGQVDDENVRIVQGIVIHLRDRKR